VARTGGGIVRYTTALKSKPYFFKETSEAINLKYQGLTNNDIKKKIIEENIFRYKTESRKKEVASTILKRLTSLDEYIINEFNNSSIEQKKFIILYAILKTDRLFFEFMIEVFREKFLKRDYKLKDIDFEMFFRDKAIQSETVDKWQEYTLYKLKQVYIRILFEASMINDQEERKIQRPIVSRNIVDHLVSKGDEIYMKAMLGVM
jgi:hypothetical protein